MGALLGLLGLGGGGGSIGGSSSATGQATSGAITVNAGSGSNVALYVLIGVLGFLGLVFLMRR